MVTHITHSLHYGHALLLNFTTMLPMHVVVVTSLWSRLGPHKQPYKPKLPSSNTIFQKTQHVEYPVSYCREEKVS